jgi:RNA polymerase sigma-70 factor, ECF subfamily
MSDAERELLNKAKKGDVEAFEQLIEGCQKKVFNIALRMIGNYEDASELAQEVFIKIFKSIKNFREDSLFSTWVYKVTTNICIDELRRRKNRKVISLDEEIITQDGSISRQVEDLSPTPQMQVEKKELKKIVNEAIKELSEEHRAMIIMREIQGFSYEEIAQILKCPEGTVKSRINRARNQLRQILKDEMELLDGLYVKQIGGRA